MIRFSILFCTFALFVGHFLIVEQGHCASGRGLCRRMAAFHHHKAAAKCYLRRGKGLRSDTYKASRHWRRVKGRLLFKAARQFYLASQKAQSKRRSMKAERFRQRALRILHRIRRKGLLTHPAKQQRLHQFEQKIIASRQQVQNPSSFVSSSPSTDTTTYTGSFMPIAVYVWGGMLFMGGGALMGIAGLGVGDTDLRRNLLLVGGGIMSTGVVMWVVTYVISRKSSRSVSQRNSNTHLKAISSSDILYSNK